MGILSERLSFDPGSSELRIIRNGELVLTVPGVIEKNDAGKATAVGTDVNLNGSGNLIYPVECGMITDFHAFEILLRASIRKLAGMKKSGGLVYPSLVSNTAISDGMNEVNIRAFRDALEHAGSKDVYMMHASRAIYLGLAIDSSEYILLIDAGAGKAGISILNQESIVLNTSVPVGLNKIREALEIQISKETGLIADRDSIDKLLDVIDMEGNHRREEVRISGQDQRSVTTKVATVYEMILPYLKVIENEISFLLQKFQQDHQKQILKIVLTGGMSRAIDFEKHFAHLFGLPVEVRNDRNYVVEGLKIIDRDFKKIVKESKFAIG